LKILPPLALALLPDFVPLCIFIFMVRSPSGLLHLGPGGALTLLGPLSFGKHTFALPKVKRIAKKVQHYLFF
jgi:hypothetical protein